MFKKIGLVVGLCCALPLTMVSAASDGSGCGLGKLILEGKSGTGANVATSIINSIYGNQTFAMSLGTSGCDTTTVVQNDVKEKEVFVASNMDNLSVDVARGQGDYLASLAHIMKINEQDKNAFYSLTQDNYEALFVSADSSEAVLVALDVAMASDGDLSKYVE